MMSVLKQEDIDLSKEILDNELNRLQNKRNRTGTSTPNRKIPLVLSHWDTIDQTCKLGKIHWYLG